MSELTKDQLFLASNPERVCRPERAFPCSCVENMKGLINTALWLERYFDGTWKPKHPEDIDELKESLPIYLDDYLDCFGTNEKVGFERGDNSEFDSHLDDLIRTNFQLSMKSQDDINKSDVFPILEFVLHGQTCAKAGSGYLEFDHLNGKERYDSDVLYDLAR